MWVVWKENPIRIGFSTYLLIMHVKVTKPFYREFSMSHIYTYVSSFLFVLCLRSVLSSRFLYIDQLFLSVLTSLVFLSLILVNWNRGFAIFYLTQQQKHILSRSAIARFSLLLVSFLCLTPFQPKVKLDDEIKWKYDHCLFLTVGREMCLSFCYRL